MPNDGPDEEDAGVPSPKSPLRAREELDGFVKSPPVGGSLLEDDAGSDC